MKSWTVQMPLRRVFLAVSAWMLLSLVGGMSLRPAQAADAGELSVMFSFDTPPIGMNAQGQSILCQGQAYRLLAEGISTIVKNKPPQSVDELITVSGVLNPIEPNRVTRLANTPKAVFVYDAAELGQDVLDFESDWLYDKAAGRGWKLGRKSISVEVRACDYEVTFVYDWNQNFGDAFQAQFAQLARTLVIRKEDGSFEGTGSFDFVSISSAPKCKASISDFQVPTRITGKAIPPDSKQLVLDFKYEKTTFKANVTCTDGDSSGSKSIEQTIDISSGAPASATFPEEGGSKQFKIPTGLKPAKLTIIVNKKARTN